MIINDNADLLNLFKDALEQQKIDTYTFTDPSLALKQINQIDDKLLDAMSKSPPPMLDKSSGSDNSNKND